MASIDGIARAARDNLASSLSVTHNLTLASTLPADQLMHRMNAALRAIVDSNFDASSLQAVGALYEAIGAVQPAMMDTAHNLALVNLSRSLAVVLEEALRAKEKRTGAGGGVQAGNGNPTAAWGTSWNGATDSWQVPTAGSSAAATPAGSATQLLAYGRPPSRLFGDSSDWDMGGLKGFGPSSVTAKTAPVKPVVTPELVAERRAALAAKNAKKDYSPEAIEGRVTVFRIPTAVTEPQLTKHFEQIGPIKELSYPLENGKRKGFALLKYEDNAVADVAVAQLHGKELGGAPLSVERATYWFKRDAPPAFGTAGKAAAAGAKAASGPTESAAASFSSSRSTFSVPAPASADASPEKEVKEGGSSSSSSENGGSDKAAE